MGQSVGAHVQRESLSHQNHTNVFNILYYSIFRVNLFLPSLGIHYFSAFSGGKKKRKKLSGPSLVVQWLRFHASSAVDIGSIPSQGTKIQHPVRYMTPHHKK